MKKRMTTIFIILVFIGVLATGITAYYLQRINSIKTLETKMSREGFLIKELIEKGNLDDVALEDFVEKYSKTNNQFLLINGEENVDEFIDEELFSKEIPIESVNNISKIRISVLPNYIKELNKKILLNTTIAVIFGLLISLILGVKYIEQVTNPYKELINATKNISEGKYGEKVYFHGDEEFEILADNFNTMSIKLKNTIQMLEESNTKLKATLTSIEDGVIAIDNNLNIILINPRAEKILKSNEKEVMGKKITEAFESDKLNNEFIKLIRKQSSFNDAEVEVFEPDYRIIKIAGSPIIQSDNPTRKLGLVFVIRDVTTLRKLEKVREDFVANVSHELKTPLTSIKGFVETLQEGAIEDVESADKFLNIIDFEVNRLNSLISDLLLLSEVESREDDIIKEIISVDKVIDDILMYMKVKADKKKISLEKDIEANIPNLYGNYNYFSQMLLNLVDNGIKYTSENGMVKVSAYTTNSDLIIKVADSGIGMAKEEQERIFERFYRVDKARSNEVDGTGLGLAIVKHIVSTFNGKITVESIIGKGSVFTVILPVENSLIY